MKRWRDGLLSFTEPIAIAENNVVVRGSLGVALYPGDADTAEKLCIHADTAMYQAKKVHDSCVFYKDV
ncbi:MAG: diguanylate cyclase [Pseudomonadales bacterium]|nr:diguanylate cyclase [Pseudomonadales bacterium]